MHAPNTRTARSLWPSAFALACALTWAACATPKPPAPVVAEDDTPTTPEARCAAGKDPDACFWVAAEEAQRWNAANLAPSARAEALEHMAYATHDALRRACDQGHACACLAARSGDCAREDVCAVPGWSLSDGPCLVRCAEERACASEAFWFLAPVPR